MSSVTIARRLRGADTGARATAGAGLPAARARQTAGRDGMPLAGPFVIALVARGACGAHAKRYLARRNGRTFFVSRTADATAYASYRTAHMIGIKAAVHYGCVACIEER